MPTVSPCLDALQVGLLNVVRREGAPLSAREEQTGRTLVEGADGDFAGVVGAGGAVEDGFWRSGWDSSPLDRGLHAMPSLHVPANSRLQVGANITLDYFALSPVFDGYGSSCLSHPAIAEYMRQNMIAMAGMGADDTDVPGGPSDAAGAGG